MSASGSVRSMYSACKCECKYNVSTGSSVSVRPVNIAASIKKKNDYASNAKSR